MSKIKYFLNNTLVNDLTLVRGKTHHGEFTYGPVQTVAAQTTSPVELFKVESHGSGVKGHVSYRLPDKSNLVCMFEVTSAGNEQYSFYALIQNPEGVFSYPQYFVDSVTSTLPMGIEATTTSENDKIEVTVTLKPI